MIAFEKGKLFWLQLSLLVLLVLSLLASKIELIGALLGFNIVMMALMAVFVLMAVSMLYMLWNFLRSTGKSNGSARSSLVLGALPVAVVIFSVMNSNFSAPLIHDISTDLQNPPVYSEAVKLRTEAENSLEHEGEVVAEQQRQAYPEIQSLVLSVTPTEALTLSEKAVAQLGWKVLGVDSESGQIEAVDQTLLFGFKDDVVIRIQANDEGAQVDIRSVSRVGMGDMGANAKRVKAFLALLNTAQ